MSERVVSNAHDGPLYTFDAIRGDNYGVVSSTVEERGAAFTTYAPACHHPNHYPTAQLTISVESTDLTAGFVANLAANGLDQELQHLLDQQDPEA